MKFIFNPLKLSFVFSVSPSRGSAMLGAIVTVGIIAATSLLILNQTQLTSKTSRGPRIKSAMLNSEIQLKRYLLKPSTYTCTSSNISSCTLAAPAGTAAADYYQQTVFPLLKSVAINDKCTMSDGNGGTTAQSCALQLLNVNYNSTSKTFTGTINFPGASGVTDNIKDVAVSMVIPDDVLLASISNSLCNTNSSKPLFGGYDASGAIICNSLPAACPANTYIKSIDPYTLTPTCSAVQTAVTDCSAGSQVIANFTWNSDNSVSSGCAARADLYSYMNFQPQISVNGASTPIPSCSNGATNYPTCNTCPGGYYYNGSTCVAQICTPNSVTTSGCPTVTNGTSSKVCNSIGTAYGSCSSSCSSGYTATGTQPSITCVNNKTSYVCQNGDEGSACCPNLNGGQSSPCVAGSSSPGGIVDTCGTKIQGGKCFELNWTCTNGQTVQVTNPSMYGSACE